MQGMKDGSSSLNVAAGEGYEAVVRVLLENGADLNARDEGSGTALHKAVG